MGKLRLRSWCVSPGRTGREGRDPSMSSKEGAVGLSSDIHATAILAMARELAQQTYAFQMHSALGCPTTALALVPQDLSINNSSTAPLQHNPWPSAVI